MKEWDHITDLLVVGSGGGGMTAALIAKDHGLDALVIEKANVYGGSTAMSGGSVWVPNNHLMQQAGLQDSPEEALAYLISITAGKVPEDRLRAYLAAAPAMLSYLEKHSHVKFQMVPGYSDYYPDVSGARPGGGRTIEAAPFNARRLGHMRRYLRPLPHQARLFGRMMATAYDAHLMLDSSLRGRFRAAAIFAAYFLNPARSLASTDTRLTLGNALSARLYLSLEDRGVPLWLNTGARHLILDKGRVIGLEANRAGRTIRIRADKGVVLAAGGFARNRAMRDKYQRQPISSAWTVACPENTGDAIQMGLEAGGTLDLMDDAWWMPTSLVPGEEMPNMIIVERSLPGSIVVNAAGKRFTNEAAAYIDVVKDQYARHWDGENSVPAYLIMDRRFRRRYPTSPMLPGFTPKKYVRSGYLKVADTLEGLAQQCDIDPAGLVAEVTRFNRYAASGSDPEFGRGARSIDRYYGDPAVRPNACLAPLDRPPYYAIELWPGDLGTKGGLVTDAQARVLRQDGSPIEGLYATGNCAASVMGHTYAGAGATIGPSMVFGYVAALHASRP
ncbi:MAG: 3-oxosteroid 1-dehydrogenase [Chloroflexi bacterium]|nr:MAG: 3-oxosteroid 1-dehydrogenase [Chloroflexota bacterium]